MRQIADWTRTSRCLRCESNASVCAGQGFLRQAQSTTGLEQGVAGCQLRPWVVNTLIGTRLQGRERRARVREFGKGSGPGRVQG